MDIKFHITKIIDNGSHCDDWINFIDQLKQNKCDRDLLSQIYTVALNNIADKKTKVYKKLLVGLSNLQNEISPDLARQTLKTANSVDYDCAVVCVYYAQFEYVHGNTKETTRILREGKCDGRMPKVLLKRAYNNMREKKTNLLEGIPDPWDESLNDVTDTATITQPRHKKSDPQSPKVTGIKNPQPVRSLSKVSRNLGQPTRVSGKTQSASSLIKEVKNKSPTEELKEKLGLMVGENFENRKFKKLDERAEDSGVFVRPVPVTNPNKENVPEKSCVPSLSPFMVDASPLVNRSSLTFLENTPNNSFHFSLFNSTEKSKPDKSKKDFSQIFEELFKDEIIPKKRPSVDDGYLSSQSINSSNETYDNNLSAVVEKSNGIQPHALTENHVEMYNEAISNSKIGDLSYSKTGLTDLLGNLDVKQNLVQKQNDSRLSVDEDIQINANNYSMKNVAPAAFRDQELSNRHGIENLRKPANADKISPETLKPFVTPLVKIQPRKPLSEIKVIPQEEKISKMQPVSLRKPLSEQRSVASSSLNGNRKLDFNDRKEPVAKPLQEKTIKRIDTPQKSNIFSCPKPPIQQDFVKQVATNSRTPLQPLLQVPHSNTPADVVQLVESGLSLLERNGYNVGSELQKVATIPSKVFVVNGNAYKQIKCIGKGGSCKVYEVVGSDGHIYALKKVKLEDLDHFMIESYLNEIKWLEKMKGAQCIIQLKEWERTNDFLLIVMEKGDSDLANVLRKTQNLQGNILKLYWRQMLEAVQTIHDVGIIHADLKPANFLFVGQILKLIDFGIANGIQGNKTSVTREYQMGTLNYMPPEALTPDAAHENGSSRISRASDVWSLGCMLYMMVFKKTPYQHIKNQSNKMLAIQRGQPIEFKGLQDELLLDCLQGCLKYDKRQRYTINELLAHRFLTG